MLCNSQVKALKAEQVMVLTFDNVPCVKRVAQALHSTGLLIGPLRHFGDSVLTARHVINAGIPLAAILSCMFLQHVFEAMVSISQKVSRPYRDAQDRLLWRDKTCPART